MIYEEINVIQITMRKKFCFVSFEYIKSTLDFIFPVTL